MSHAKQCSIWLFYSVVINLIRVEKDRARSDGQWKSTSSTADIVAAVEHNCCDTIETIRNSGNGSKDYFVHCIVHEQFKFSNGLYMSNYLSDAHAEDCVKTNAWGFPSNIRIVFVTAKTSSNIPLQETRHEFIILLLIANDYLKVSSRIVGSWKKFKQTISSKEKKSNGFCILGRIRNRLDWIFIIET